MSSAVKHFLLVFDHAQAKLVDTEHFGEDVDAAVAAYGEREERYRNSPEIDIVLIGSDSLDTVKLTHANYFDGSASEAKPAQSKYLAGI